MTELTDFQVRLLQIIDEVRWGEEEKLDGFKYHLVVRALGLGDHVIAFEIDQAVAHYQHHNRNPPPSPPPGALRSPWIETWDVEPWRLAEVYAIDLPDMDQFEIPEPQRYDPETPDA